MNIEVQKQCNSYRYMTQRTAWHRNVVSHLAVRCVTGGPGLSAHLKKNVTTAVRSGIFSDHNLIRFAFELKV